jgi:hypothetical protein
MGDGTSQQSIPQHLKLGVVRFSALKEAIHMPTSYGRNLTTARWPIRYGCGGSDTTTSTTRSSIRD